MLKRGGKKIFTLAHIIAKFKDIIDQEKILKTFKEKADYLNRSQIDIGLLNSNEMQEDKKYVQSVERKELGTLKSVLLLEVNS